MHESFVAAMTGVLGFSMPGGYEWIILLVLGLLIFGRRLPEVGRSLGKGIVEFKKGIKGIEEEIDTESSGRRTDTASKMSGRESRRDLPRPSTVPDALADAAEADEVVRGEDDRRD